MRLLPNLFYTPPGIARKDSQGEQKTSYPPEDLSSFATFVRAIIERYGERFDWVELWNEPNWNPYWSWDMDPDCELFAQMAIDAADVVHEFGKKALLGGTTPLDYAWFGRMHELGVLSRVEAIERVTTPMRHVLLKQRFRLRPEDATQQAWLTEYGFPVKCPEGRFKELYLQEIQTALFAYATDCLWSKAVPRIYWYTYQDHVGESVRKHTTGWEDVLQYYYGDTCEQGSCRLLGRLLDQGGPERVHEYALKNRMFELVDAASLRRTRPAGYMSNNG